MIHALIDADIDPYQVFEADQKKTEGNSGSIRSGMGLDHDP